ncbi:MAG: ankyrin repeat domain-containing protein [Alphaproteobacteria bacterium]|nr:ankyrin repeat domain-containing protein [Alphaproteobacteria bacterium]
MRYKFLACLLGLFFISQNALASDDLYKIITTEDKTAFLDLLSTSGFELDEQDVEGNTPLMIASALGKTKFVEFLVNLGAKTNKKNYVGITALHRAAQNGHNDIIDILIDHGAQVNMPDMDGITPLMKAVEGERRFTVELLVHRGAYIQFINRNKKTAVDIAKDNRFHKIHQFLLNALKNENANGGPNYSWEDI